MGMGLESACGEGVRAPIELPMKEGDVTVISLLPGEVGLDPGHTVYAMGEGRDNRPEVEMGTLRVVACEQSSDGVVDVAAVCKYVE